jgi:hypothetical protein
MTTSNGRGVPLLRRVGGQMRARWLVVLLLFVVAALLYCVIPAPVDLAAQWVADRTQAHSAPAGAPPARHVGVPPGLYRRVYWCLVVGTWPLLVGGVLARRATRRPS